MVIGRGNYTQAPARRTQFLDGSNPPRNDTTPSHPFLSQPAKLTAKARDSQENCQIAVQPLVARFRTFERKSTSRSRLDHRLPNGTPIAKCACQRGVCAPLWQADRALS